MLPTANKHRLPKHLSYPLNASSLSAALVDLPQVDLLRIWFHRDTDASESARPIVLARYKYWRMGMSACNELEAKGFYGPSWDVWVYSIPSQIAAIAREQLLASGLPQLRAWLCEKRSEIWYESSHQFSLMMSTSDGSLVATEAV